MKKKIAIAVDGSVNCTHAVRYAAAMSQTLPGLHYVLIHVEAALSQYLTDEAERSPKARRALQRLMEANREASTQIIEKVQQQMIRCGVEPDRIETRARIRMAGIAEDLLDECQGKSYDALVIGRRGITHLQELVTGSVTSNVVAYSDVTPVWMVDDEVPNSRVVLAADGSQNALRALDHLAFMLSGREDAAIHIIHVNPKLKDVCEIKFDDEAMAVAEEILLDSDRHCIDGFHEQAKEVIRKNGLDPGRLEIQTIKSRVSVAGAVIDAARKGGFGSIAMGRRGLKKGKFTGSVSRKVLQKATRMAVWVVP
jgi:nucleotide-binding universal stress UspA family protein